MAALGKAGFFFLTLAYALADVVPRAMAWQATPDLVLAALFLWSARPSEAVSNGERRTNR